MTLKDIAKISRCSVSTVSKALNDSHEISRKTKTKISKIATKHNYRPNYHAANLRKRQNIIIGVILPNLEHISLLSLLEGITEETTKHGHRLMTYQSNNQSSKEKKYIELLSDNIVNGLVFYPINRNEYSTNNKYSYFNQNNYPIKILYNENIEVDNVLSSSSDDFYNMGKGVVQELLHKINHSHYS